MTDKEKSQVFAYLDRNIRRDLIFVIAHCKQAFHLTDQQMYDLLKEWEITDNVLKKEM